MLKKYTTIFIITSIFLLFFVAQAKAEAVEGCAWESKTEDDMCMGNPATEGYLSWPDEVCGGNPPPRTQCCCTLEAILKINSQYDNEGNKIGTTTEKKQILPSVFGVPDLKVSIPGLNKFEPATCMPGENCSIPWLSQYIAGLQRYAVGFVSLLAVIVIMIGGVIWLTAGGNQSKIGEAKKLIGGGIGGVVLTIGAYVLLYTINPDLTILKNINISYIDKVDLAQLLAEIKNGEPISQDAAAILSALDTDGVIKHTVGKDADDYKALSCDKSMFDGGKAVEFFTTGYYKPNPWSDNWSFFCDVGLQCSCPPGVARLQSNGTCKHKYSYCDKFTSSTPYCTSTASGKTPAVGMIAADDCFSFGDKVCLGGKVTLTVEDRGGAIKGRRFDIYTSTDLKAALGKTGVTSVTLGACQ